ncbi:hypothetical protein OV208_18655 [Corallococcus sp. bb12-1]|uniref:hypothetical protein n=1 Tax=Corallococcus sp. bb12-1 TaxID=2996784 RepID=UPI00226D7E36|nr:hypothetical protein [Corallococcus sp. bb12-1]MCY1043345.1 hypothetical protein [Corallococcus sp. bb12-1]
MRQIENIWRGPESVSPRSSGTKALRTGSREQPLDIVIRRYRRILLGRLYQVRDAKTGAPSIDLHATGRHPDFQPDVDMDMVVSARAATADSPSRLRFRLAHVSADASNEDVARVTEGALSLAKAMVQSTCTRSELAETMAHLRAPARPRGPVLRSRRHWRRARKALAKAWGSALTSGYISVVLAGAAILGSIMMPNQAPDPRPTQLPHVPVGLVLAASTPDRPELSLDIPDRPLQGQKTKDCDPDASEQMIKGACWVETSKKAPCGDKQYEYKGKCYRAAGK